jgi:hypothetical protein
MIGTAHFEVARDVTSNTAASDISVSDRSEWEVAATAPRVVGEGS